MTDSLDKRMGDVEMMLAHLPSDLDVRFAGLQGSMGRRFDQMTLKLQTLGHQYDQLAQAQSVMEARLGNIERVLTDLRTLLEKE